MEETIKSTLLDVFVNWLEQRFKDKGKKEIEKMLLGELPDLRETQSGRDLIQIGREEGRLEGKKEALTLALKARFGPLDPAIQATIDHLQSIAALEGMLVQVFQVDSIDDMQW